MQLHVVGARELRAAVVGLALIDAAQMRGKAYPPLYSAGVRYRREGTGKEHWQTASEMLASRRADCEDLVAYRLAELWSAGEKGARPVVTKRGNTWHVTLRRASGQHEDPSRKLGM